jgi:hypothetical protein
MIMQYKVTAKDKRAIEDLFCGKRVVFKRDGSVEVRHSYYYRHGATAEKLEAYVLKKISNATIIDSGDNWQPWPKDSYFWVRISIISPIITGENLNNSSTVEM